MRIAFLADSLDTQYAGIHIYTKKLLNALSKTDKENEYLIIRSMVKNEFEGFEEIVLPNYSFPGYKSYRYFIQIPRVMVKRKVDIVVEPGHFGPFNLPKSIKRITVIHDLTPLLFPQYHTFIGQSLQRIFLPSILKNTDHIITNSEYTRQDLIKFFPFTKDKSTATLLGKDKIFTPRKDESVLKKYRITKPYILFVGTLEPRKNLPVLLEAFNKFKKTTGENHQLVFVGKKGWKSEEIFQKMEASPFKKDIILPGYIEREHLPILYSMAEVFVYPSLYEGFGLPVIEAMACGTPVITSNISSLPEVGGAAGIYFDPNSSEELTDKLSKVLGDDDLRKSLGAQGLVRATQFSWKKTALKTKAVFERLMDS